MSKRMKNNKPQNADWQKYKIRTCRTMLECAICNLTIFAGEEYYDGGYGRRAHKPCAERQPGE